MAEAIDLKDIPDDIGESYLPYKTTLRQRQQAKKFSTGSYIDNVKIFRTETGEIQVKSDVYRSQEKNNSPHRTSIGVDPEKKVISDAFCDCKAGISGECSHVLAVVMKLEEWILQGYRAVPAQQACTSLPQQWDKPRGSKIKAEPVSSMVIAKPGTVNRKRKPLTAVFDDNRKNKLNYKDVLFLNSLSDCPISYQANISEHVVQLEQGLQYVGSPLSYHLPLIKAVEVTGQEHTFCGQLDFPQAPEFEMPKSIEENEDKWGHMTVTQADALKIERSTRDQAASSMWHSVRKGRITASNFGRFMLRKAPITDKFLESILQPAKFTSAATSYGSNSEKVAKNMYRKKTKNHVHDCGVLVNSKFPFIGASPDGKICDNGQSGILEVKCPFSIRDWTISDALVSYEKKEALFLEKNGDEIKLKKTHPYWYQVQGQLLVSGAKYCDFVTYTRQDLHIQRIEPDVDVMTSILDKLCDVFIHHVAGRTHKN